MIGFDSEFLVVPFILVIVVYFFVRIFIYKNIHNNIIIIILDIVFVLYCFLVINLLFFPFEIYYGNNIIKLQNIHINLIPFVNTYKTVIEAMNNGFTIDSVTYLFGNFFIFVPLSLYLILRFPKSNKRNFSILISVSLSAEILQLLLIFLTKNNHRVIDIDDLILNFSGAIISWLIVKNCFIKS